jgi:hypothetical protein
VKMRTEILCEPQGCSVTTALWIAFSAASLITLELIDLWVQNRRQRRARGFEVKMNAGQREQEMNDLPDHRPH